ncbi:hypothetical protein IEN85_23180 [Pelagicoccus sp. NFK12]|uniref:Uncharacterized protein n=1 Tax=Pelagicoccus enzymogenes TaxID=2773457 RepID=A0A927FCC9_9BACT|nr:hypothetical protein [Pelagicoccus enzymogenes]MBD5782422.1 hypothetical protein [Pelagicoccus enzymogenes]
MESLETIETDFAAFEILPGILIMRCRRGIKLGLDHIDQIQQVLDRMDVLTPGPVGWISDKVNSYSIDPLMVRPIQDSNPKIRSWCNVVYGREIADYKKLFEAVSVKNFGINSFNTLPPAIDWTYEYLGSLR